MSVYDVDKNKKLFLYSKSGTLLPYAYDVNGEVVFEGKYNSFIDSTLYATPSGNNQGFDVYDGKIIQYIDGAHTLKLIGISSGNVEKTLTTDTTTHGNDVTVSPFFYDDGDEYPIVFIDERNGFRIDVSAGTATQVYTINNLHGDGKTSWVNYGAAFNGNIMYTIGYSTTYTDTNSLVFIETWDLSESIENPTLISQVTRPWVVCVQGAAYHDGLLWCACGIGDASTGAHIYAFDPTDASIVHDYVLNHSNELEGIAWVNENGEDFIIYGEYKKNYHKVTFS